MRLLGAVTNLQLLWFGEQHRDLDGPRDHVLSVVKPAGREVSDLEKNSEVGYCVVFLEINYFYAKKK